MLYYRGCGFVRPADGGADNAAKHNRRKGFMTRESYENVIAEHYRKVAEEQGDSPCSTMADQSIRRMETEAICGFVADILSRADRKLVIADVGCGNGYTLEVLSKAFPGQIFLGLEKTPELFAIARKRFEGADNVRVVSGDIRNEADVPEGGIDILLCQRVLINLLDAGDQQKALNNLVNGLRKPEGGQGGHALFIESFNSSLANLNEARSEFDLDPIAPAHHNQYLADDYFDHPGLRPYASETFDLPSNLLSTYYFTARVLHAMLTKGKDFKRNSEFVKFFSAALAPAVGDYSPLKFFAFSRKS
ncbi:methyltransferase family protein [Pseudodesulfovibrio indicus]|uniref:Methyltransferase family protein n=2 Tax=Pseudodesulfovibrio indicus TaxID=1716143 RepID=A0AA94PTK9_9BACT|nr:methyltransferase family protein [Pseudodesulfovibrio indicus]